jgi:nucleoside-diphosphate-sugar epimerase
VDQVTWISGDVFVTEWDSLLDGVQAVISTLGMIGPNDQMERINADANIIAVNAAKKAGVPKFVYISVHDYNLPEFALNNGYFAGKRKAEAEILSAFPNTGTILRPGFIYGKRRFNGVDIPLDIVGKPLERALAAAASLTGPLQKLPASDLVLAPPVDVDDVALAAIRALQDDYYFGIFNIEQIKEMAKA